jgi:hypothetical protein
MRVVLAVCATALAVAAPAAAVSVPKDVTFSPARQAAASGDKSRSCEAGAQSKALAKARRLHPVACEQPPKSNLLSPNSVAKATSAALSVLG